MNIYHKTKRSYSLLIMQDIWSFISLLMMQEIFISCIGWRCVQRVIKGMYAQRWLEDESTCSTKGFQMHLFDSPPLQLPWSIKNSAANTYHSVVFSFKGSSLNPPFSRSPSWDVKSFALSPYFLSVSGLTPHITYHNHCLWRLSSYVPNRICHLSNILGCGPRFLVLRCFHRERAYVPPSPRNSWAATEK